MITRTLAGGVLAAGLILSSAATGHAGGPDEKFKFHDTEEHTDEFLSDLCETEIIATPDVRGTVRLWDDGRIHVTEHGRVVFTNTETGKTLTREWTGLYKGAETVTVDPDGTETIRFHDENVGIPERWRDHNGKVLIFDRGRAVFDGVLVFDKDGNFVSFDEDITTNGPHPILDQGFLNPSLACDLLS